MKALSLTQPWASLVATGAKEWETRSYGTGYRGLLAIHASARFPQECRDLCAEEPFLTALGSGGAWRLLPLGAVIAVCRLLEIRETVAVRGVLSSRELAFGDYSPGRYAWRLRVEYRLTPPIPAKGALSLWNWDEGKEALPGIDPAAPEQGLLSLWE